MSGKILSNFFRWQHEKVSEQILLTAILSCDHSSLGSEFYDKKKTLIECECIYFDNVMPMANKNPAKRTLHRYNLNMTRNRLGFFFLHSSIHNFSNASVFKSLRMSSFTSQISSSWITRFKPIANIGFNHLIEKHQFIWWIKLENVISFNFFEFHALTNMWILIWSLPSNMDLVDTFSVHSLDSLLIIMRFIIIPLKINKIPARIHARTHSWTSVASRCL